MVCDEVMRLPPTVRPPGGPCLSMPVCWRLHRLRNCNWARPLAWALSGVS